MTESKLGTITPGRYKTRDVGGMRILRRDDENNNWLGILDSSPIEYNWEDDGKFNPAPSEFDLIERIGDLNPVPGDFVPSGFPPDAEIAKVYDKDNEAEPEDKLVKSSTIPSMPNPPPPPPPPRQHHSGNKGHHCIEWDGMYICEDCVAEFSVCNCFDDDEPEESKPDALVIEAGNKATIFEVGKEYISFNGQTIGRCLSISASGDRRFVWQLLNGANVGKIITQTALETCGMFHYPHTPAPKKVYRMADESELRRWATWCAFNKYGGYVQYEFMPIVNDTYFEKDGGRSDFVDPEHAPQDLPDDFDWRDSLVMVKVK